MLNGPGSGWSKRAVRRAPEITHDERQAFARAFLATLLVGAGVLLACAPTMVGRIAAGVLG